MKSEIELLREEINRLQTTVKDLQSGTMKIETNAGKLMRLKNEILDDVFQNEFDAFILGNIKKHCSIIASDIFPYITGIRTGYSKMSTIIFEKDSEQRLSLYLSIYRNCCEFIKAEYNRLGYPKTWEKLIRKTESPMEVERLLKIKEGETNVRK